MINNADELTTFTSSRNYLVMAATYYIQHLCHSLYTIERITLAYPVWYNEIHKKLPDVQFFRHETKPSPHMIRNADEIWFQTNALSHKLYYAVMNRTAGYPVKIRYFHSTSATKCAEELIQAQSA